MTMTLTRLAVRLGITMRSEWSDRNPAQPEFNGDHWRVTLNRRASFDSARRRMSFIYSKGYGHNGAAPTLSEVMECLQSDSSCPDSFEEFCGDYGYDTDSRRALATFNACRRFAERIEAFFGTDLDSLRSAEA